MRLHTTEAAPRNNFEIYLAIKPLRPRFATLTVSVVGRLDSRSQSCHLKTRERRSARTRRPRRKSPLRGRSRYLEGSLDAPKRPPARDVDSPVRSRPRSLLRERRLLFGVPATMLCPRAGRGHDAALSPLAESATILRRSRDDGLGRYWARPEKLRSEADRRY